MKDLIEFDYSCKCQNTLAYLRTLTKSFLKQLD